MAFAMQNSQSPRWAFLWLWAAGIYNLAWGLLSIAFPHLLFDLVNAERINYPEIWQCVGMATILTNDLLWWIPFTMILREAWRDGRSIHPGSSAQPVLPFPGK